MKYKAIAGARFNDDDANIIGRELEQLGPACTAEAVVAKARRKASPLHPYFDWNDARAAQKHRLEQARYYIRHIEVIIVTPKGKTPTRAWHHVSIEHDSAAADGTAYVSTAAIRNDRYLGEQVINAALRELEGWQRRYREYKEVFGCVFQAITKAKIKVAQKNKMRGPRRRLVGAA